MNENYIAFKDIKKLYLEEWILLGNLEIINTLFLGGFVLLHNKDKKEVCYISRDKTKNFQTVTIAFAGDFKQHRKIGILK